jgi:hypothetical protein
VEREEYGRLLIARSKSKVEERSGKINHLNRKKEENHCRAM